MLPKTTFKATLLWHCCSKKIEMTIAAVNYIRQYQAIFSQIEDSNINFWYKTDLPLLNNKKDYLLHPYGATSSVKFRL